MEIIMGMILLLALSVSLDTLGVGMAYAMKKVKIPWNTRLLITAGNIFCTGVAVHIGMRLGQWIPTRWFCFAGGSILVGIGLKTLWNALGENRTKDYDKNESHSLEPTESIMLALTLALDSMCAGLGIGNCGGTAYLFPILTGAASLLFLSIGTRICGNLRQFNGLAGCVLIILGLFRFVSG
jgi:putative Mn2+ efflux pump MntP